MHEKCECEQPNKNCPRYGSMIGRKWQHCQGINASEEIREIYLNIYSGKGSPVNEPNKFRKALNYATTKAKHFINFEKEVSEEVRNERLKLCSECPNFNIDGICNLCGCPIEEKIKLEVSQCPDNPPRWKRTSLEVIKKPCCGN